MLKVLKSINQNWGVAIGFLSLLFVVPFAVIMSDPNKQFLTSTSADASRPIIKISPSNAQGIKTQFSADISDENVDRISNVDFWFGKNPYSINLPSEKYSALFLQNYVDNEGFNWRADVFKQTGTGERQNITSLLPDDTTSPIISKIYSSPSSNNGEIILSASDSNNAVSSVKFRKVTKVSSNLLRFNFDVELKSNFDLKDFNIYMRAKRSSVYGSVSSVLGYDWLKVGNWSVQSTGTKSALSQNTPPRFTCTPVTNATVGSNYKMVLTAVDDQNDPLTFEIYQNRKPSYITLNGNLLSGTPTSANIGTAPITVLVRDPYGNTSTLSWNITVSAASTPVPTKTPTPTTIPPTTAIPTTKTPSPSISITSPKQGDKFTGTSNKIIWTTTSLDNADNYKISYAQQGSTNFKDISTVKSPTTNYLWDVSSISNGSYILKVEAFDSSNKSLLFSTSSQFSIDNSSLATAPSISRRTPEQSTISDTMPTISAVISPSPDMSTLQVFLDDQDITSKLDKSSESFAYTPLTALSYGDHTVKLSIRSVGGTGDNATLKDSWTFNIKNPLDGSDPQSTTIEKNKIKLPLINVLVDPWLGTLIIGLFVLSLFAILIIAIIALIRIIKGKDEDTMTHINKYYQENNPIPPVLAPVNPTIGASEAISKNEANEPIQNPFTPNIVNPNIANPLNSQNSNTNPVQNVSNSFDENNLDGSVSVSQPYDMQSKPLESYSVNEGQVDPYHPLYSVNESPSWRTENETKDTNNVSPSGTLNSQDPYDPFKK